MKLLENFRRVVRKLMKYHSRPILTNKNITTTQKLKNFQKMFCEFSVNYRKTAGDSYLTEYPTILFPHFSQVYLSKHANVSVNSKPDHPPRAKPPGNFFDVRIPHPPGKKEVQNPHPRGIFLNYSLQKHEKMRQKSCKTARFYHLQMIKR